MNIKKELEILSVKLNLFEEFKFEPRKLVARHEEKYTNMLEKLLIQGDSYVYGKNKKQLDELVKELDKGTFYKFIKKNPYWIDSFERVEFLINHFSEEENKKLAKEVGCRNKEFDANFYSTIFSEDYNTYSTYIFVGGDKFKEKGNGDFSKSLEIENFIKLDSEEGSSLEEQYRQMKSVASYPRMMGIRATSNNKTLFKINTEKDLLDEYVGMSDEEMPDFIVTSIAGSAKKI